MADKTFRGRIEALRHNPDESLRWRDLSGSTLENARRADDEALSFIDGYAAARRDALEIAAEADAEIESLRAALDMATKKTANLHSALMAAGVPLEVADRIMDGD